MLNHGRNYFDNSIILWYSSSVICITDNRLCLISPIFDNIGSFFIWSSETAFLNFLPIFNLSSIRSNYFKPISHIFFWLFIINFFFLGWLGQMPVREPYITFGQMATFFYFIYFLFFLPFLGLLEDYLLKRFVFFNFKK